MRLVWLTTLLAVMVALFSRGANGDCGPRVRKNWNALTDQEKTTFMSAIEMAMDTGAYSRFIEMHTEMMSEMEAHGQCMFVYWHRLFTLVLENMLRGQSAQFACVTVPYWDWITDNSRHMNGQCHSMGGCSSVLMDMGGVPAGMHQSGLTINGIATMGFCVNTKPIDRFCESKTRCSRCVPRGDWNATPFPATTSYASVMNQLFSATSIGQMSPNLEKGAHNKIHSDLDGVMSTLASPAEPVFWTHHSMVDLLHVIFHKCRVGTEHLTFEQKASHPVAWASCGRRNGSMFNPTDIITMRTGGGTSGRPAIPGSQDPLIGRYFQGVPNRFADLMDVRDLGYSYELSGVVATMYANCDGRTAIGIAPPPAVPVAPVAAAARLVPAPVRPQVIVAAPRPATVTTTTVTQAGVTTATTRRFGRSLRSAGEDAGTVKAATLLPSNDATQTEIATPGVNATVSAPAPSPVSVLAATPPAAVSFLDSTLDPSVAKVIEWHSTMMSMVGGPSATSFDEVERMMCSYQDQCEGGATGYSPEFKKAFAAEKPRCQRIVDDLNAGKTSISLRDWKERVIKRFGCPQPKDMPLISLPVQETVA